MDPINMKGVLDPTIWGTPVVTAIDPSNITNILYEAGKFACISRLQPGAEETAKSREDYEAIGMRCLAEQHRMAFRSHTIGFRITGISRVAQAQLRTHSIGVASITQSQRYIDSSELKYTCPPALVGCEAYEKAILSAKKTYKELLEANFPPEVARYCLPQASNTAMTMHFTPDALLHFLNERLCEHTDGEVRNVATKLGYVVLFYAPKLARFIVPRCIANPTIACKNLKTCATRANYGPKGPSYD